jgi:hypothetical protein
MASCSYWLFRRFLGRPLVCWCPWVWWIPNRNAAALLRNNIRNDQLLHRGCTVRFTVTLPRVQVHHNLCCSELLHRRPEVLFFPGLHYQIVCAHLRGSYILHHQGTWVYTTTYTAPSTTPRFQSTTALRHRTTTRLYMLPQPATPRLQLITSPKRSNTVAPKYDGNQSSEHLRHPTRQPRSFE